MKKSALVTIAVLVTMFPSVVYADGSGTATDKNDVKGVLDIKKLAVSWTDTTLSLAVTTFDSWKRKALLPEPNFIRGSFTGPEDSVKIYDVQVYTVKKSGIYKLVAPIVVDGEVVAKASAVKLAPNKVRFSFPRDTVK
ncbi:MAG: hypothetical protein H0V60_12160 [Actinobacteria bacterium]|nr:hypothetical protein [Actinomycetota bacterium]